MNVQDQIPLQETTFFILLSLSRQPRHGYAILQDVAQLSNGRSRRTMEMLLCQAEV